MWADIFSCFRRKVSESEILVAPSPLRAQSIASQDGYGTMSMSVHGRAGTGVGTGTGGRQNSSRHSSGSSSRERDPKPRDPAASRQRMADISRAAGNHMKPVSTNASTVAAAAIVGRAYSPMLPRSTGSSRNSSPSPLRPMSSPPGGVLKPRTVSDASTGSAITDSTEGELDEDGSTEGGATSGVVHKSIFTGDRVPSNGSKSSKGSKGSRKGCRTSGRRASGNQQQEEQQERHK